MPSKAKTTKKTTKTTAKSKGDDLRWDERGKRIYGRTGRGVAVFPSLHKPDDRFDKKGVYKVALRVDESEPWVQELIEKATRERDDFAEITRRQQRKKNPLSLCDDLPWKQAKDGENELPGQLDIGFKMNARVEPKDKEPWDQQPALFDAQGNEIPFGLPIGGGSELRVSFEVRTWNAPQFGGVGVSFRLLGVQVLKHVAAFGGDAKSHGFGSEEDGEGFVYEQEDPDLSSGEEPDGPDPDDDATQSGDF